MEKRIRCLGIISCVAILVCFIYIINEGYKNQKKKIFDSSQINQSDYTKIVYSDGSYYYQSLADHFFIYKSDESERSKECLLEQVPKELYVWNDWIYFSNLSDGEKLYRVRTDGTDLEKVLEQEVKRFFPFGDKIIYISPNEKQENCLYSWSDTQGVAIMYEGGCRWICSDGNYLYLRVHNEEDDYDNLVILDHDGKSILQEKKWIYAYGLCQTDRYEFYVEDKKIICRTRDEENKESFAVLPEEIGNQGIRGIKSDGENLFILTKGNDVSEYAYSIYLYDILEKEIELIDTGEAGQAGWDYWGISDFCVVNGRIFFKLMVGEGKGELWHWVNMEDRSVELFEDMEPYTCIEVRFSDVLSAAASGNGEFWDSDYEMEDITYSEDGDAFTTSIKIPQVSKRVQAYQEINEKIMLDAQNFIDEQMECAEDTKQRQMKEWENQYMGDWKYIYAYADSDYVSIVYWKFLGMNGLDKDFDRYIPKLYSAQTGEEIEIDDLFRESKEEILLRISFAIRKSEYLSFFHDDAEMLERFDSDDYAYRSYFILMEEGIDIYFITNAKTNDTVHFIIEWEELREMKSQVEKPLDEMNVVRCIYNVLTLLFLV